MSINLTRQSLEWTFTWVVLLLLLFWARGIVQPVEITASFVSRMPLGVLLENFASSNPILSTVIVVIMVLSNTVMITRIVTRNMIYTDKAFLPAIIYIIISCGNYFGTQNIVGIITSWLVIYSSEMMINSFRRQKQYGSTFTASILLGTTVLIYAPSIIYIILIPCALSIFRKDWHEIIISIMGYLLPFAICSYIYWGMGEQFSYLGILFFNTIVSCSQRAAFLADFIRPDLLTFWGITVITTILSLWFFMRRASLMRTRPYKSYIYFIWMLIASTILFIVPCKSITDFPLIAIPLAVIMPTFFNRQDGWITNTAYILLMSGVVLFNLLPLLSIR